ncbi:MAG: molybdopterin-dependent oxidoreductase [Isosphaeraceae bacterium]
MTDNPVLLRIDGAVERPLNLTYDDLRTLPESDHVLDVSRFHPDRKGDGVALEALLRLANPAPGANYLTLHAGRDDFHASIPLPPVRDQAVVVFRQGAQRLGVEHGGPIRLIIRDPLACRTGELDDCANVKYLDRIELTEGKGQDTRPVDDAEHAALHERQQGETS